MKYTANASFSLGEIRYVPKIGTDRFANLTTHFMCSRPEDDFLDQTLYIANQSKEASLPVTNLYGLDAFIPALPETEVIFQSLRGDDCSSESFRPFAEAVSCGSEIVREPAGSRSSDTAAFPYFDISFPGMSIVAGIGWSGKWRLSVSRTEKGIYIRAGQADCDIILEPEEEIRSVRVLMLVSDENVIRARQLFTERIREYASPDFMKKLPYRGLNAIQCFDRYFWNADASKEVPYFETEEAQIRLCEAGGACGTFDYHWMDACWFKDTFRSGVGNYSICSAGFSNGLLPVADAAHENGMKFIVWFEPVRAFPGTEVWERFSGDPRKLIRLDGKTAALVNLGDPEVWQWVYNRIVWVMETYRVDSYRQDFNLDPHPYLASIETGHRVGMEQMRFTMGIYRLWDALSEHFPGLLIDNCASGGRLLDVETCARAIPLWQTDVACRQTWDGLPASTIHQNCNAALSRYIAYHQASSFTVDAYSIRSGATGGISCEFDFFSDAFDSALVNAALTEVRRLAPYHQGDFTPLSEYSNEENVWSLMTWALPGGRGLLLAFRRSKADAECTADIPGIDEGARYYVTFTDEARRSETRELSGKELARLRLSIPEAPGSLAVEWTKI